MALLSVIVPAFNRGSLIGETLRSLLAQTLPADEIIVVDDGSTDNTAEVAESFGHPVMVIRRPNGGPAAARNTGMAVASGEYIHFFDSDDLAAPNKQEVQVRALQESGADIAVGPWLQGQFSDSRFIAVNHVLQQRGLPNEDLVKAMLTHWSFVLHSALFRRRAISGAAAFDESLFLAEDQMILLRCLLAGAKVVHTAETIEFYRLGVHGKITENGEWSVRRLREWARFLIKARDECLAKGVDPLRWFGYRRRLWEVEQDLSKAGCQESDLLNPLRRLAPRGGAASLCHWHRKFERWLRGTQQRVTGARAHRYFRMAPINPLQVAMLLQLGYVYQSPQRWSRRQR
jgi:glycosyltransferase involved in cell wall biosynthesis